MLSKRQERILNFIRHFTFENGYPPSIREICMGAGISSTSVANYNLNILEKKDHIHRDKTVARGIRLVKSQNEPPPPAMVMVPFLGHIAAGQPIDVPDGAYTADSTIAISCDLAKDENIYALKVKGFSMIDAFINDGDTVIMKPISAANDGDMVAVWLTDRDETTLKRFYHEGNQIRLQPENTNMQPIYVDPHVVEVQGKVVAVIRQLD